MAKAKATEECRHAGYLMKDGELVCAECGEPSPSKEWKQNVYGAQSAQDPRAVVT